MLMEKIREIRIRITFAATEIIRNLPPKASRDFTGLQILFYTQIAPLREPLAKIQEAEQRYQFFLGLIEDYPHRIPIFYKCLLFFSFLLFQ